MIHTLTAALNERHGDKKKRRKTKDNLKRIARQKKRKCHGRCEEKSEKGVEPERVCKKKKKKEKKTNERGKFENVSCEDPFVGPEAGVAEIQPAAFLATQNRTAE